MPPLVRLLTSQFPPSASIKSKPDPSLGANFEPGIDSTARRSIRNETLRPSVKYLRVSSREICNDLEIASRSKVSLPLGCIIVENMGVLKRLLSQ